MKDMILLDIETMDIGVESDIYGVSLMVIEDKEVVFIVHIAVIGAIME